MRQKPGFANCVNTTGAGAASATETPASAAQTPAQANTLSPTAQASQAQAQAARSSSVFFGGDRTANSAGAGSAGSMAEQGGNPLASVPTGLGGAHGRTAEPGAQPAQPGADVLSGNGQIEKQAFASTTSGQDYITGTLQRLQRQGCTKPPQGT